MKNKTKKILITAGTILALMLTFAVGVYAAEYIPWSGTDDFNQTQVNHGSLRVKIEGLFSQRDKLQKDLTTITTERDGLVTEKEKLITEKEKLITEKEELESVRDGLQADIVAIKDANKVEENRLKQEIVELNKTIGNLNNQITALDNLIKEKDDEISDLNAENKRLKELVSGIEGSGYENVEGLLNELNKKEALLSRIEGIVNKTSTDANKANGWGNAGPILVD